MNVVKSLHKVDAISVPVWVVTLLVTLFLGLSGFAWNQSSVQSKIINTLDTHDKEITTMKGTVATRHELLKMEDHMLRIENKLDRVIEKR